ncbi:hypothetical protein EMIT0232MI5_80100 [Pseudomonas sp. IT-232MI5]
MHHSHRAINHRQCQPQGGEAVGHGLAAETDALADVEHQREQDQAEENDNGGVHGAFCLMEVQCREEPLREEARSHNETRLDINFMYTGNPCGSEPARERATSVFFRA